MNFYLVFTKNRKRFDKYVKVNRIKNKIIIGRKAKIHENGIHLFSYKNKYAIEKLGNIKNDYICINYELL